MTSSVIARETSRLRKLVDAAIGEFDQAVVFHEAWKPAAGDDALHARMGKSYATNVFNVIRVALRREVLLALGRLWDGDGKSVGFPQIAEKLHKAHIVHALIEDRLAYITQRMNGVRSCNTTFLY